MVALLETRAVSKEFGGGWRRQKMIAVDNFSLSISSDPPSILALVGESGSGKTTIARLMLGLAEPDDGAVLYKGANLQSLSSAEQRAFQRDVQVIFQDPFEAFNPFYRVDHVLMAPLLNFGIAATRKEARRLIEETLRVVGLRPEETLGRFPHQLSGGQRQRVMVARALLIRPRIIIADEPVSMVDASLRATILASLRKLHDDYGISLIYITHDLTTAYQICQNIIVLYRGSIAEVGDAEEIVRAPMHPYTRLLIGSIPNPDPDQPWTGEEPASTHGHAALDSGCRFASRCPSAMEICRDSRPPLFLTGERRAAACYLYRDGQPLAADDLDKVLSTSNGATTLASRTPGEALLTRPA